MKQNTDKYLSEISEEKKIYLSLPLLLAKKVKKGALIFEHERITNTLYNTGDFKITDYYKNITPNLPQEYLETIFK